MTENSPPSRNPADNDSLPSMMKVTQRKFLQGVDDMLPAKVIAYDRATNRAMVQPLIDMVNTSNEQIPRNQIASVPVLQLGGGGYVISFPLNEGDLGWVKANDRDISLFLEFFEQSPPNTLRFHSFEDCLFISDTMLHGVTIAGGDVAHAVFQNYAGTVKISLSETDIVIDAPTGVTINTETAVVNASTEVTINSPQSTFTGIVTVDKTLNVLNTGSSSTPCVINGSIQATGDIVAEHGTSNISLASHIHSGVQTGGGDTGPPV